MRRTTDRPKVLHALGLFATAAAILGPALAWLRLVPAMAGFLLLSLGGLLAIVVAVSTGVPALRGRGNPLGGGAAVGVARGFLRAAARGARPPLIHGSTTDPARPPRPPR